MVHYHLIIKGYLIQLGSGGTVSPKQVQGSFLIITIIVILIIIFLELLIKSQSNLTLMFLIKLFLIKEQCIYQTYDIKYLNADGK